MRKKIASGFYDDPGVVRGIADKICPLLWRALDRVPVGSGAAYRDRVRSVCAYLWRGVFDDPNTGVEVAHRGARIDIEFPLRLEVLNRFPLLQQWAASYGVRSILTEVKNEKRRAAVEDAKQLVGDLAVAQRGRLGFLITRSGFSRWLHAVHDRTLSPK